MTNSAPGGISASYLEAARVCSRYGCLCVWLPCLPEPEHIEKGNSFNGDMEERLMGSTNAHHFQMHTLLSLHLPTLLDPPLLALVPVKHSRKHSDLYITVHCMV